MSLTVGVRSKYSSGGQHSKLRCGYPSFLYIDRIVVRADHQGNRLGSALYAELFRYAAEARILRVTCEFDTQPPNEASRLFHVGFGFREVGTQWVADGKKQVSLQEASIAK